jgi:hypothetical protein
MDLVVANDTVQNFVFRNNQNGTFAEQGAKSGLAYDRFGSARGAMGIDTANLTKNNTLAVSIGNFANEMTALYMQKDQLYFTDQAIDEGIGADSSQALTFGVFFFDPDLDGFPDLLTVNGHIEPEIHKLHPGQSYAQPAQLFWNAGGKSPGKGFVLMPAAEAGPDLYQPLAGRGSAFADIDGDGDQDVLLMQAAGPPLLLKNEQKLNHNWIRIKLAGSKGNRDAIGAVAKLHAGNRSFAAQVMPAKGYLSSSEPVLTFGLGSGGMAGECSVIWPDGSMQTFSGLKINQVNVLRQK